MPTTFRCPNGHLVTLGVEFHGTTFSRGAGGGGLIGVTCPTCGVSFDGGPPSSGVYSTSATGELRKVADWVGSASLDELLRFRDELNRARAQSSQAMAKEALAKVGFSGYEKRMELWQILAVLLAAIAIVIAKRQSGDNPTPPDINIIINQCMADAEKGDQEPAPSIEVHVSEEPADNFVHPDREYSRNEPCPCDSGRKYKRCHGGASRP